MEPKEAAQAAAVLTQAMKDPKNALKALGVAGRKALSVVAARMEPKEARPGRRPGRRRDSARP